MVLEVMTGEAGRENVPIDMKSEVKRENVLEDVKGEVEKENVPVSSNYGVEREGVVKYDMKQMTAGDKVGTWGAAGVEREIADDKLALHLHLNQPVSALLLSGSP